MFIDASAIVAILAREPDAARFINAIETARAPLFTSPLAVFEASIALARIKTVDAKPHSETIMQAKKVVLAFMIANSILEIEISAAIGQRAIIAAARYGKITGHRADLNFGDCFAYAAAQAQSLPMLFKGNDFAQTDIRDALNL